MNTVKNAMNSMLAGRVDQVVLKIRNMPTKTCLLGTLLVMIDSSIWFQLIEIQFQTFSQRSDRSVILKK